MPFIGQFYRTMLLLLTVSSILLVRHPVSAFAKGAGTCLAGTDAILQPGSPISLQTHGTLEQIGTGPLEDYGLVVSLDGKPLDASVSNPFAHGQEHVLSIVATNETYQFTGFLMRLESPTNDRTIEALSPIEVDLPDGSVTTNGVQVEQKCRSVNFVGGVTHTSRDPKQQVDAALIMDGGSLGLELDVSVVVRTSSSANVSEWYFSRFILDAVDATPSPTMTPSAAPSDAISDAPTTIDDDINGGDAASIMKLNVGMLGLVGSLFLSIILWF